MPEEIIIRKSRWRLFLNAALAGAIAFEILRTHLKDHSTIALIAGIIALIISLYNLYELAKRTPQIILSQEGIYLRHAGLFTWDLISSFSTMDEGSENPDLHLVIHFTDYADQKFSIQNLGVDKKLLIQYILKYTANTTIFYAGHK